MFLEALNTAKVVRNLGSDLIEIKAINKGYQITYTEGDICDKNQTLRYSTQVTNLCDLNETGYGEPVI